MLLILPDRRRAGSGELIDTVVTGRAAGQAVT
jgi:hypothetical protein